VVVRAKSVIVQPVGKYAIHGGGESSLLRVLKRCKRSSSTKRGKKREGGAEKQKHTQEGETRRLY